MKKAQFLAMPKIELHVHLEGSVQPATLIDLAKKNGVSLPAADIEGIRRWYSFSDFNKFIEVYLKISECIKTTEDIEFVAREFLKNQKAQNVLYSEVIFTPYNHYVQKKLAFSDMIGALERAKAWGKKKLGISCNFIMDISREVDAATGAMTAEWILESGSKDIVALGLGGPEIGFPPERHVKAFDAIRGSRIRSYPHAGETVGAPSVWGALKSLGAGRIAHGVRSIEDPMLVKHLVDNEITLDTCPTSNLCLNVYPDIGSHSLPRLVEAGVRVTINSDDPPMFNTTLTDEYRLVAKAFGFGKKEFLGFNKTAIESSFLSYEAKKSLERDFAKAWQAVFAR